MSKQSIFDRIVDIKKSISGKLFYEFIFILILMVILIGTAFGVTEYIANYSAVEQARQSAQVIFQQAEERMDIYMEDIENLFMNAIYNSSVSAFFGAKDFPERWSSLNGFYQVVSNNKRISRYLENILLYDLSDELIGAQGDVVFPMWGTVEDDQKVVYSDGLSNGKDGIIYFEVGMPVYQEIGRKGYNRIGTAWLLFNAKYLQNIVEGALPNESSAVAILDGSGKPLALAGDWKEEYAEFWETEEVKDNLVNASVLGNTGWRIISVIPKESMSSGVTLIQKFSYMIYAMTLLIMGIIVFFMYFRIIKPVSRQIAFVSNFTKDVNQRIQVVGNNEISELARKMNEMLDDIETLNMRVIETHRQYLELEYAKKNTEMIAYRGQINPHFLYNTFNCIRGMALYRGEKDIADLTMALSSFFRYSIHGEEIITVREVLENLQYYTKIIDYRFGGKHCVRIEASEETYDQKLPKMLIQPLVENAVLHGLEPRRKGDVWVTLKLDGAFLSVCVKDEGQGIDKDTLSLLYDYMRSYDEMGTIKDNNVGIGVLNVYRRFRLFYGEQGFFELKSAEGEGTCVRLLLPIELSEEN